MNTDTTWGPSQIQLRIVDTTSGQFSVPIDIQTIANIENCHFTQSIHHYSDPTVDETLLHNIEHIISTMKEIMISQTSVF